jgi:hypothetical protein
LRAMYYKTILHHAILQLLLAKLFGWSSCLRVVAVRVTFVFYDRVPDIDRRRHLSV